MGMSLLDYQNSNSGIAKRDTCSAAARPVVSIALTDPSNALPSGMASATTSFPGGTADSDVMVTPDGTQPLQELQIPGNAQRPQEPQGRAFSTPVTAARLSLNLPTKDMVRDPASPGGRPSAISPLSILAEGPNCCVAQSPMSRRDLIHKTNEQIVQALNRRQMTGEWGGRGGSSLGCACILLSLHLGAPNWAPGLGIAH